LNTDIDFTLFGNTGEGIPEATDSDIKSITYGNYALQGFTVRYDTGGAYADIKTFLDGLAASPSNRILTTTRVRNITGQGAVLEHSYYAYPVRFGFATFLQNGIPGGWKRLKRIAGDIMTTATFDSVDGDELDILVDNEVSEEAFYVYQSTSDNISGALFAVN
jgi:hypothetical protein